MKIDALSFNIHKGFGPLNRKFTLHDIKEFFKKTHADIVFLQEVVGENRQHAASVEHWPDDPQYEFLADELWHHHAYAKNAVYEHRHHGNVILSKYPIIETNQINISKNQWEKRGVLFARIEMPNGKYLDSYCVHLNLLNRDRKRQYADLRRIIRHYSTGNPIILAGDFNDWNKKASPGLDELGIYDAHKTLHGHYARTFPSILPLVPLDRCYTNLEVIKAKVLYEWSNPLLSDHCPILIEVKI